MTQLLGQKCNECWVPLLDEFDRVMCHRFRDSMDRSLRFDQHSISRGPYLTTMMPLAIESNLYCYVYKKVTDNLSMLNISERIPLLALALQSHSWQGTKEDLPPNVETLAVLLRLGADPNQGFEHHSIWQCAIHCLHILHCLGYLSTQLPK
jgi:hypothetical protein